MALFLFSITPALLSYQVVPLRPFSASQTPTGLSNPLLALPRFSAEYRCTESSAMSPNGSLPSNNFRQDITSTAAPPSIDHPGLDLLIRSASSLLSLICKQAKAPERSEISNTDRRLSSFLSRIALILITKDEGDIAAVSLVLETSKSEAGSSDAKFKTLWNTRNSPPAEIGDTGKSKEMALPEILPGDGGKRKSSEDWLSECYKQ